jgi:dipeptidyl aminopeptidase/acylaminoacyl peptidase
LLAHASQKERTVSKRFRSVATALAVFIFCVFSIAEDHLPNRLEPLDVFGIQVAAAPQISPDGKRIVYVRQSADISSDHRISNLWIINFDGSEHRPLTTGIYHDDSPRLSPDGTRIAYVSDRDGKPQLYIRWIDSGETAKLTDLENAPSGISWSPDGKQLAFTSLVSATPPKIATLPAAPEGAKWADPPKLYEDLIYRFNGPGYLKAAYTQVFVVAADGGAPRQLTSGNFPHGPSEMGGGSPPTWAPEGKSLIISMNGSTNFQYEPLHTELFEINVNDGSLKQLTHRNGPNDSPDISPDGKLIVYTGFDDRYQGHQTTYLYVANRDGSDPHPITPKLDRDAEHPRWAADGKGIFFTYADQGDTKLAYLPIAPGSSSRILADHLDAGGNFTIAKSGAFAVQYDTPADPGDVAAATLSNPKLNVLTSLNRELFTAKKLGAVEELWYESSVDKRKIEGWVIKPPDFDASKKYPLALLIHGGPFSNYGDRFMLNAQLLAAKDYVVLYTNPRGSTSYGEEFSNLIHHAYPGDDFYDLNSGVDAVLAKGYVDADNLFVVGGSGGGVLTCWMIGRTDRFRAAASLFPVINWYSWVLTSDLPSFGTQYWFSGNPWDHPDEYIKRSVISLVKNVKTPTLLMTGDEDFRTPISEAEQYYAALKLLKVESALVRFPGEPHGLSRRPSHQVAANVYILNWFDSHRKKP